MKVQTEKAIAHGDVHIVVYDKQGKVKLVRDVNNIVVNLGRGFIASRMIGDTTPVMSHMAVGSDDTLQTIEDEDLGSILDNRVSIETVSNIGDYGEKVEYHAVFLPGVSTGAITEAAIFNDETEGVMLCRTTFPVVNKQEDDTIAITWTISINSEEVE